MVVEKTSITAKELKRMLDTGDYMRSDPYCIYRPKAWGKQSTLSHNEIEKKVGT